MPQSAPKPGITRSQGATRPEERLRRVLLHERGLGYSDKAVIGGLDSMIRSFAQDIEWINNLPPRQSRPYAALGPGERQIWVENVLRRIGNPASPSPATAAAQPSKPRSTGTAAPRARRVNTARTASRSVPPPASLSTPVSELGFISRANAGKLAKLNVQTLKDLLWLFPRRHIDYSTPTKICHLEIGLETTVLGHVVRTESLNIGRTGAARVLVSDGTGLLSVTFFGQPYLVERLKPGTDIALSGKVGEFRGQAQFENPEYEVIARNSTVATHAGNLLPVYPATDGLPQRTLRTATRAALDAGLPLVKDMLPAPFRSRLSLPDTATAISDMHFPAAPPDVEKGRRRLAFDELLLNQLLMLRNRVQWQERKNSPIITKGKEITSAFLEGLEFTLTEDQQAVLNGLLLDMETGVPMARLLQGEVGSGKTIVALSAMIVCVANGYRGAFLAPTEVLAEQHFLSTTRQLGAESSPLLPATFATASAPWNPGGPISIGLLTGSQSAAHKTRMHQLIASGEIDIIIGTHALLQETVDIPGLALAVVDEQHRFGVEQRAALIRREPRPHMLAMSATPIPRTLALTVYGDLDVSLLKQMPRNRLPLKTTWARDEFARRQAYEHVHREVAAGRQAFIVCPLIDDSEAIDARAAVPEFERLVAGPFAGLRLGLLHGRMPIVEKQAVMEKFRNNEVQVLVATPVIEVGVDVPNATVMLIESADRFGLSQLHQLRGRVGRGQHQGTCYLLSDSPSDDGITRLRTVEGTADGFALADKDLEMRGPGDYTGTRQSGWALMQIATPADLDLIETCRVEATTLLEVDLGLTQKEHALLATELERFAQGRPGELS